MAAENRATALAIKEDLLANGRKYSYFQAIRLLRLFERNAGAQQERLRIRPKLALGFPENDVDRIEALPEGGYRVTANFFGLYGVASPLPAYYTEDLFAERREGGHVARDFLDIVHYAMYPLLFDAWKKYRIQQCILEEESAESLDRLYAFSGLANRRLREAVLPGDIWLLRYAGLFHQQRRTALGLQTMLSDAFAGVHVEIDCLAQSRKRIEPDQRWALGQQTQHLGEDVFLGSEVDVCGSQIVIRMSDVAEPQLQDLLPGNPGHRRLHFLTNFYLSDSRDVVAEIHPRKNTVGAARFGGAGWSRLGLDTWLSPRGSAEPKAVRFGL
jgi:type VI secretion system protein ImpH